MSVVAISDIKPGEEVSPAASDRAIASAASYYERRIGDHEAREEKLASV